MYLVPILGFFAGYFLGSRWNCPGILTVAGFLLGWVPALCYNAYVKKRPPQYTLTAFAEQQRENKQPKEKKDSILSHMHITKIRKPNRTHIYSYKKKDDTSDCI